MATASVSQSPATHFDPELLVASLTEAIQTGDVDAAKNYVAILSNCHTKLNIDLSRVQIDENKEKEIDVTVHVEDRESMGTSLNLSLRPSDSILDLKRKVWVNYKFPVETQRWIIGKRFPDDATTLLKCGVSSPGCTIFLYLVTPHDADFQQHEVDTSCDQFGSDSFGSPLDLVSPNMKTNTMTFNGVGGGASLLCEVNTPSPSYNLIEEMSPPPVPARQPVQFECHYPYNMSALQLVSPIEKVEEKQSASPGWYCNRCTYHNLPTRPGCEMCAADRPENYTVPEDYQLTELEVSMLALQVETERQTRQRVPDFDSNSRLRMGALPPPACPPPTSVSVNPHELLFQNFLETRSSQSARSAQDNNDGAVGSQSCYSFLKNAVGASDEEDEED